MASPVAVPLPEVVCVVVVAAVLVVAVAAGAWVWKASTPVVPATVAARTMGDRRMSEGERFEVDAVLAHAGGLEFGGEVLGECVGAAEIDLAAPEVGGDEIGKRGGVERHLVA